MTSESTSVPLSIPHTFTLAPSDTIQFVQSPCRVQTVSDHIRCLLCYHLKGFKWELHTEVTYPAVTQDSSIARIHYHGVIYFQPGQKTHFFTSIIHHINKHIRIEVDTINDLTKWQDYYTKHNDEIHAYMQTYCSTKKNPYPYILSSDMPPPRSYKSYLTQRGKVKKIKDLLDI